MFGCVTPHRTIDPSTWVLNEYSNHPCWARNSPTTNNVCSNLGSIPSLMSRLTSKHITYSVYIHEYNINIHQYTNLYRYIYTPCKDHSPCHYISYSQQKNVRNNSPQGEVSMTCSAARKPSAVKPLPCNNWARPWQSSVKSIHQIYHHLAT